MIITSHACLGKYVSHVESSETFTRTLIHSPTPTEAPLISHSSQFGEMFCNITFFLFWGIFPLHSFQHFTDFNYKNGIILAKSKCPYS